MAFESPLLKKQTCSEKNSNGVKKYLNTLNLVKFQAFDVGVRSGTLIDLNGHLYHIGGVHCTGNNSEKPGCSRTDAIYKLQVPNTSEPWKANWINSGLAIAQPKSSHDILKVPLAYCNRILPL